MPPFAHFADQIVKLNTMVSDFISKRKEQDTRFDPEQHAPRLTAKRI